MNIQFLGAAQTVTGSCYILEACGARFAVDCGMHQGNSEMELRNFETKSYRSSELNFILLTHAHIDHSGLIPRIMRDGFKGPIYCTPPTADLVALMLEDSAHIQETEAEWRRKKINRRSGQKAKDIAPLYTVEDAQRVPEKMRTVEYAKRFSPHPGIEVTYRDAGHILGSAFLEIQITEDGKTAHLVFSGDLGRPGTLLMHKPAYPQGNVDFLFVESTYGNRDHKNEAATLDELAEAIQYSYSRNDRVIIPAFAVGRTQEILYCLHLLNKQGRLPHDMPVIVDSPLATRATEVFKKHLSYLDIPDLPPSGDIESLLPNLRFTVSAEESQALNTDNSPAIILSASGMCNAGRIRHHLRHNAWRPNASIVFVGYQGIGTPGRKIVDGAKTLRLFNEDVAIEAKVFTIGGFSAHAGQSQLLDWVDTVRQTSPQNKQMQVILIHGEVEAQTTFAELLRSKFSLPVAIPGFMEEMTLQPGAADMVQTVTDAATSPIMDWELFLGDTEQKMSQLRARLARVQSLPWDRQVDVRDRLLELNKEMLSVLMSL